MAQARSEDSKAFKKINFKFGNYKLRYAWVSQRGYYPEDLDKANQDAHWEVENFGNEHGISDCAYFAVYDGHGKTGDHCAGFARDNIHLEFAKQLGKVRRSLKLYTAAMEASRARDRVRGHCSRPDFARLPTPVSVLLRARIFALRSMLSHSTLRRSRLHARRPSSTSTKRCTTRRWTTP